MGKRQLRTHVVAATICRKHATIKTDMRVYQYTCLRSVVHNSFLGYLGVRSCHKTVKVPYPQRCHLFTDLLEGHAEEERGLRRKEVLPLPPGELQGHTPVTQPAPA